LPPDESIAALVRALRKDVASLKRYGDQVSWDEFVRNEDRQNMVLFALFRAAQTAVDIGQRLLASRRLGGAETYAEVFERLGQQGILSTELAERMRGWAGLRNVIAHLYRIVDLELIYRAYTQETCDLEEFSDAVENLPECRD